MKWKNIIFDFDGVLVDSNEIRYKGFEKLFEGYPQNQVEKLVEYSRENGGISRYKKILLFFEEIRGETISEENILKFAQRYSSIVAQQVEKSKAIKGSVEFLENNSESYIYSIVSGSDQDELQKICNKRGISQYFCEILGSPVEKTKNLRGLVKSKNWKVTECLYIGDSINDYDAALANNIDFLGRDSNTMNWNKKEVPWIKDLTELEGFLQDNNKI